MSSTDSRDVPVLRIVKKAKHVGHHGGAWKVAYADFVTAMMALFIVLWILGQSPQTQKDIAGYFRDPIGKGKLGAGPKEAGIPTATESARGQPTDDPIEQLESEAEQLRAMIETQPSLKELANQISVEVTPEGVRVEINENEQQPLFESGSARLSTKLTDALRSFAGEFAKLGSPIIIEGHTDSAPYAAGSDMTNWDLSTHRATEARRALMLGGLPEAQISMIRGFADRKPRYDNPKDPRNRRISILLLSAEGERIMMGSTPPPLSLSTKSTMKLPAMSDMDTQADRAG